MILRRITLLAACLLLTAFFSACTQRSGSKGNQTAGAATVGVHSNLSYNASQNQVSDIAAEAQKLSSTSGRVALALIICRLDSSNVLEELAQKNAQELLQILRETASQKSQTLESIDEHYFLKDILASEGIYVDIKSNAVTTLQASSKPTDNGWIAKFQSAIDGQTAATASGKK